MLLAAFYVSPHFLFASTPLYQMRKLRFRVAVPQALSPMGCTLNNSNLGASTSKSCSSIISNFFDDQHLSCDNWYLFNTQHIVALCWVLREPTKGDELELCRWGMKAHYCWLFWRVLPQHYGHSGSGNSLFGEGYPVYCRMSSINSWPPSII